MCAKGNFSREDIVTVLTANQGNVEAAFQELNKVQLKPFLMRIWGQGEAGEVTSGQDAGQHCFANIFLKCTFFSKTICLSQLGVH